MDGNFLCRTNSETRRTAARRRAGAQNLGAARPHFARSQGASPPRAHRRFVARPRFARRAARPRQDRARQIHRPDSQARFQAHPVHARPHAGRRARHAHFAGDEFGQTRTHFPARPGVHEHFARGRNQPRFAENTIGHARNDAGKLRDAARHDARLAAAVFRFGEPESD